MKPFYVTSPIFYPNAQPHLGHAYATLLCDVLTRYHARTGEAYFLTGTDEHTEKVVRAAQAEGKNPAEYLEIIVTRFKELYKALDISYSQFIRTSDRQVHWPGAIEMWNRLQRAGKLELREYSGLYCIGCEAFKTKKDLVDGKCSDHGTAPEKISETNWFFKLSEFGPQLKQLIESDTLPVIPASRKREILAFIDSGLEDVSFSRPKEKMTWGIPVPHDPTQSMYIWVDALSSYITALGFGRGEELMRFWPGTHLVGKDILRFHAVFWPAMLLTAGLPLPQAIFIHGTIISGGKKMSKTLGNVIDPLELIKKYGTDATRYMLLRHVHPTDDSDVTWERLDEWYTAHLANGLGNLVARVMKLAEEYLPAPVALAREDATLAPEFSRALDEFRFNEAMDLVFQKIADADALIAARAPYKGIQSADARAREAARADIAALVLQLARIAAHLGSAMPATSEIITRAVLANKKPENLFPRLA